MKRTMVVTILALALCLTAIAQEQEKKPSPETKQSEAKSQTMDHSKMSQSRHTEDEVMKLEDQWIQSRATKDPTSTRNLLADDFLGSNPNGEAQTKQQFVDSVTAGNFASGHPEYSERKVRVYGDTAISTGLVSGTGPNGADRIRYMRVYVKRNNQWQIVAIQATRVTSGQ
ncbi:MAG TPA: nuclear transport factor 2 family protein [Blastocatellia bacterium]|jgi:ketosteroid isomerase-like protein|nr:nuclear transport factor 2 family protein [Blastocatellia bacterium]